MKSIFRVGGYVLLGAVGIVNLACGAMSLNMVGEKIVDVGIPVIDKIEKKLTKKNEKEEEKDE